MDFISLNFAGFLFIIMIGYYVLPLKIRWYALLVGSFAFYYFSSSKALIIFVLMIILSYLLALLISFIKLKYDDIIGKMALILSVILVLLPLLIIKNANFILIDFFNKSGHSWIIPMGISFFTLQMIAYLADVYKGKVSPQTNLFKYALFISFFHKFYRDQSQDTNSFKNQLIEGHIFDENEFMKGLQLILWGFFLKLMIADKAAVIVDTIFNKHEMYVGGYVFVAGILYSIQLYADFLSCITIAQGVSELFGIHLADNFNHPYFATSIRDFWRRWHISFSIWLRDYIYIPLGGNRKGKYRKYLNIIITFMISGLWHGAGYKYIFWGCIHAGYQIFGELTSKLRDQFFSAIKIEKESLCRVRIKRITTLFGVMLAWIIFRADSLKVGISMVASMFLAHNPWIFFNGALFELGLPVQECFILLGSVVILFKSSKQQEKICIRETILARPLVCRWTIYLMAIIAIYIFGTYGSEFNAKEFIYGGF